jgi:hypothetical protein
MFRWSRAGFLISFERTGLGQTWIRIGINKDNVGSIAERIVSDELEYRGYRVSNLNNEGLSANDDLLAVKDGVTWQIQVKGSTEEDGFWFGYGHATEGIVAGIEPAFNRKSTKFYKAEIVVLVCVKSPSVYQCLILSIEVAERAAQINMDHGLRTAKSDGSPKKPGKIFVCLDFVPKVKDPERQALIEEEVELLKPYRDNWNLPEKRSSLASTPA